MCGIAGEAGTPDTGKKVKKMLSALAHRGPDACGIYQAGNISIGNTLLKITGDMYQPLLGKGALVLNGEIFNFKELALEAGMETDSDTEVLFSFIEQQIRKGKSASDAVFSTLSKVNGDYALAYAYENELILARDPVGVKPLFYSPGEDPASKERREIGKEEITKLRNGENMRFNPETTEKEADIGSEAREAREVRKNAIRFASEKKALNNIGESSRPFPPGSVLSLNIQTGIIQERSLKIEFPRKRISNESEAVSLLNKVIRNSVQLRLKTGSGIAFSGGIDSTFLAALAKKLDPTVSLYSIGLPGSHDILQAKKAAKAISMENSLKTHLMSFEEIETAIPNVIYATESVNPLTIAIGLPLYLLAKTVNEDGKRVLLTGQGADELFGGYKRHEAFLEKGPETLEREIFSDLQNLSTINLERDDMVTMANSVELRVPFLDKEVVKIGLAISSELKVLQKDGVYIRKYILRKAAESLLPPDLLWKEKKAIQYGTGVQKVLDKLARDSGFSKSEGNHIEKYLKSVALQQKLLNLDRNELQNN